MAETPPDRPAALPALTLVSPLPPARNGIADYAALLLGALQGRHYACAVACEAWEEAQPPAADIPVLDAALAHRHAGPGERVLHQLGNNAQHGFVLRALRRLPGVTTLHDPGLLHLHEVAGEAASTILAGIAAAPAPLGPVLAVQRVRHGAGGRAVHALCDLSGEVLARSRAVIVHSRFAAARLRALHGAARTGHVDVVPHLLPPRAMPGRAAARAALGLPADGLLVVTAGFATRAKRFDWLLAALEQALAAGTGLAWIHAGAARPEELDLAGMIARASPALRARARITGHLDEAALDAHIAAADLLVTLRFPSLGESSGNLARGLAAGTCCLVTDTAAYAELPRDAVLHIPAVGAAPALAAAIGALARAPALARAIGAAGRRFAEAGMGLGAIAAAHAAIIEATRERPPALAPDPAPAGPPPLIALPLGPATDAATLRRGLAGRTGRCRLFLGAPDAEALAALTLGAAAAGGASPGLPPLLEALLPPEAALLGLRVLLPPAAPGLLVDIALPAWRG